MTRTKPQEWSREVRLLSLLLAGLLWLSVILERPGEVKLLVSVRPESVPAGLRLTSPPPGKLEVTVSGPRILLLRLQFVGADCGLDLTGTQSGTASFTPQEDTFGLGRELKVVRVSPASVSLTLAKEAQR